MSWGCDIARDLSQAKWITSSCNFNMMYWEGYYLVMCGYPRMFHVWLTKQASGFCGTNCQLSRIDPSIPNHCECCGHGNESIVHITQCIDDGCRKMFTESSQIFLGWLEDDSTDIKLVDSLWQCVSIFCEGSMIDITASYPHLHTFVMEKRQSVIMLLPLP